VDIEDLEKKIQPSRDTLPLVVEIVLYSKNVFLSDEEILAVLEKIDKMYPQDVEYVLRITGKLVKDIGMFNEKALFVYKNTRGMILVRLSFDRLLILASLPDSIFLKQRVNCNVK